MIKLGFIGFGEAASNIARGLKGEGLTGIAAYDKYWHKEPCDKLICKSAEEAGVELLPSLQALVEKNDIIISAVSAHLALDLARDASQFLTPAKIYADINATSPMTKEQIDAVVSPATPLFVDCAVMGPVPTYGHKVPVSVSGGGARAFTEAMAPYGMSITFMDLPAGSASATKMFRSIFMKGFVTLLLEMLTAAHEYSVKEDVLLSVEKTLTSGPIRDVINGLVCRGVVHSERREHEMTEVVATLDTLKVNSIMSKAVIEKLKWVTGLALKQYFNGVPPKDYNDIFSAPKQPEVTG